LSRRSYRGAYTPLAFGISLVFLCLAGLLAAPAANATAAVKSPGGRVSALGGFVKDKALARVLGETLFKDTVEMMSDSSAFATVSAPGPASPGQSPDSSQHDNSAVGRVARAVLTRQPLDKYLWLIRQAYDDSMWKGGDRAAIEKHFPLIWRTSIMLYESTLGASSHRVRVCTPTDDIDEFDCHDEIERARVVPIPAQAPLSSLQHQPNIG
jgi:hypothetical protein